MALLYPDTGGDEVEVVFSKIKEGFEKIKEQPATSEKYGGFENTPATFGVVKQLRDNDMDLHTNQTVYTILKWCSVFYSV